MRFDTVKTFPCNILSPCDEIQNGSGGANNPNCADPDYRATHPECGDDPQCSDPQFALANPTLCLNSPRLVVKPASSVVEVLGETQFVAFIVINGVETELSEGVTWSVQDSSIALIGAGSGNATGVATGITSIYATYGALTADAQLEVIADGACAARANNYLLLCDVSKSSAGVFGGAFSTRLAMAKEVAENLVTSANLDRDSYAVMKFDEEATAVQAFTQDEDDLVDAITGLAQTTKSTDLSQALRSAIDYFDAQGIDASGRVIVLFHDGETNTGSDPLPIADEIRASGVALIVVGLRAKYTPFRMLDRIASGGFFVNALPSDASSVPDWVSGMRQYLCSGNCIPEGDVTVGVGQLNFDDFVNWDVIAGHVDLIGKNEGGTPLFDFLPGNGLYVDLCGSTSGNDLGAMRTKSSFTLANGKNYRVICRLAGNQREDREDQVRIQVVDASNNVLASTIVTLDDYTAGFADAVLNYTGTGAAVRIVVSQFSIDGGTGVFGNLLDRVTLRNITDDITVFDDNFDADNPTYITPACGYGEDEETGDYGYGYDGCYNTCLESVIPAQVPDPNPLPNLENETSPTIYSSTQSAEACCENDLENCETRVASATSDISQADADQKAYAAALVLAEDALECEADPLAVGSLINLQFHEAPAPAPKTGFAVLGSASDDFWNSIFDSPVLLDNDGNETGAELHMLTGVVISSQPNDADQIMQFVSRGHELGVPASQMLVITGLPAGTYTMVCYAHGDGDDDNSQVTAMKGDYNASTDELDNGEVLDGPEDTVNGAGWESASFTEGQQFVRFDNVVLPSGKALAFFIEPLSSADNHCNGFQIKRTA